jgi:hypothetical protein
MILTVQLAAGKMGDFEEGLETDAEKLNVRKSLITLEQNIIEDGTCTVKARY